MKTTRKARGVYEVLFNHPISNDHRIIVEPAQPEHKDHFICTVETIPAIDATEIVGCIVRCWTSGIQQDQRTGRFVKSGTLTDGKFSLGASKPGPARWIEDL